MKGKFVKKGIIILLGIIVIAVLLLLFTIIKKDTSTELFNIAGRMMTALTSDYTSEDALSYKIIDEENKYVEVSGYTGNEENILLDETIIINNEAYAVTKIGNNAFENNTKIKAVKCPQNTLVEIGECAFKGCTSLKDFAYVDNVTTIGKEAFAGDIVLAADLHLNNVTSIGEGAFKGCTSITSIEFGEVTEIKESTFEGCTSLEIVSGWEDSLVSIGDSSFKGCTSLTSISKATTTLLGFLAFENLTELKTIGKEAFAGDTALIYIMGIENVTDIGESAFYNCILLGGDDYVGIFLPNITMIKKETFENCTSLKAIAYSDSLIAIEERAFKGCTSLKGFDNSNNRFILWKYNNNRKQCI